VDAHIRNGVAFQIRAMRRERKWRQEDLANAIGSKPTQITRIENPNYGSHTIATLRRIAAAFDVALIVRFAPLSELVRWDSGPRNMAPHPFWRELRDAQREEATPLPRNVISITGSRQTIGGTQAKYEQVSSRQQMPLFGTSSTATKQSLTNVTGGTYAAAI
jgi:transcriptional regulator with XRE-family HTH domain